MEKEKIIGITAEYNPFHKGHLYQIETLRRRFPEAVIIAALSGSFLQRGVPALLDAWTRAEMAVRCGVDPLDLARRFAPQIVHLHLSDHGEKGDCLPVGEGSFDFPALFRVLFDGGFRGDGVLELYRSCYEDPRVLQKSAEKLAAFSTF